MSFSDLKMCDRFIPRISETSSNLRNIVVIIPVQNEEETIQSVIQELQSSGLTEIRVIDNGSSDRSAAIATETGATVIFEPKPGYGRACWRGLQDLPPEIDWILFCDGDGSDDLRCLPQFFSLRQEYDLILGDRRATIQGKQVMTPVQHFGNGLSGWLIHWGWGYKYHDLGPLRLIRRTALKQIEMEDRGFGWTVEMQVRAIEENLAIIEIPVNYRPRQGGKSKISGTIVGSFRAGTIILGTLGKLYWLKMQRIKAERFWLWLGTLCLLSGALITSPFGDFRESTNVVRFGYGIVVMCLGFMASWKLTELNRWWFWTIAIATRLILLLMYPGDDIWRYLWEGYIQHLGFSPYDFAPNAVELIPHRLEWWSQINHPQVTAIYPPLTQLGFRGLAGFAPSVMLFKSSFALADLATCWLLTRKFSYVEATLYAWNPLVIYSFAGGGHYDSWFILPLIAAWMLWERVIMGKANQKKPNYSALYLASLFVGISIAIKWISLPILGFISWAALRKSNLKTAIVVVVLGLLPICLSAISFCHADSCSLIPTSSTFVSHGRSAEFIPHLLAKVWHQSTKNNSIFAVPLGLIVLWSLVRWRRFQQFSLTFFAALLILSPIVHGWYFTWIVPFALGTRNWSVRLVSISAFIYFVLPYRQALGDRYWQLTEIETWLLWLPFILGLGIDWWRGYLSKNK
ncbi:MAG: glycosyltransferase family 2 protein [Cyanobacteria bacterium J06623_7]